VSNTSQLELHLIRWLKPAFLGPPSESSTRFAALSVRMQHGSQ
jgi:hypothetical protein